MNEINATQIIKQFLIDVAEITWSGKPDYFIGQFPSYVRTECSFACYNEAIAMRYKDSICLWLNIQETSLLWIHNALSKSMVCEKKVRLDLADPKFLKRFITLICLHADVAAAEHILRRIINKPKYRYVCDENRSRFIRKISRYSLTCEEIHDHTMA